MTTLVNRPNSALIVIDVQNGVVESAYNRDGVVANIAQLVERARTDAVPVLWVQHNSDELKSGDDPWKIVGELKPDADEPVIQKRYGDAFEDTDLETSLAERGIGRLFVTGAQTDACVRSTLHGAFVRGYDTTLVTDAHTTEDLSQWGAPKPDEVIAHTNMYWQYQDGPGRTAATVTTADADFAAP